MSAIITYNLTQTVSPLLVNQVATGNQNSPTLTAAADGNHYFSAWVDPLGSEAILGRIEGQDGQPGGNEFLVNSTQQNNQDDVSLAALQNGGYVASFTDYSGATPDIRVRMFGADGKAVGPDFLADNDPAHQSWNDSQSDVAVLTNGKIVVTSTANWGAGDSDIHYLMYDQNGTQLQPRYAVNDVPNDAASNSSIAALTGGGFVVAYQANTGGNNRVEFTRFDGDGNILGGNDITGVDIDHTGNNTDIQIVGLSDGGFAVAYTDTGWNGTNDITARVYNADGSVRSNYIHVNQDSITSGSQDHPSLTALSNGDFAVSWKTGTDEYIKAFDATGKVLTESTLLAHNVVDGEIAALSGGLIANTYQSTDPDAGGDNSIRSNVFELTRTIQWTKHFDDLTGDSLRDHIYGGDEGDTLEGKGGADILDGGPGEDLAAYYNATSGVTASLLNPAINTGEAAGDTYVSIEDLYGSKFDDTLQGDNGNNVIYSNGGNDTVYGEGGDDTFFLDSYGHFFGGDGNDTFYGSFSSQGPSTYEGGAGDDVYLLSRSTDTVVEGAGQGHDVIHIMDVSYTLPDNVEDLYLEVTSSAKYGYGNELDNHIYANRDDVIEGRGGNDTIYVYSGNNTVDGGAGTDTVVLFGPRSDYQITHIADGLQVSSAYADNLLTNVEFLQFSDVRIPTEPARDFDGDAHSDIVWRSDNGDDTIWFMNGGTIANAANLPSIGAPWHIRDTGDFNGDGHADILWRSDTGENAMWLMNGGTMVGNADLAPIGAPWIVADVADFSGEGKADILWRNPDTGQNTIWFMDGGNKVGQTDLMGVPAPWTIADAADFNGDGKADILWRDADTGQNTIWFMDGGTIAGNADLPGIPAPWRIADTGDFDGDGRADILWRDQDTGQSTIWFMNGGAIAGNADLPGISAPWDIVETADYNGDGKSDILWRDESTGQNALWFMDGGNIIGNADLPTIGAPWHIVHDGVLV